MERRVRITRSLVMSLMMLGLFGTSAWAQTRRITGRVTADVVAVGDQARAATQVAVDSAIVVQHGSTDVKRTLRPDAV